MEGSSEFQRRKMGGLFAALDANGDGFVQEADFVALTDRWISLRGAAPTMPEAEQLRSIMMGWWAELLAVADKNRDGKVSFDELMVVVGQLGQARPAVLATAYSMFDVIDANGDGGIGLEEYRQMVSAWKQTDDGVDVVFPLLDLNGDGRISRDEFGWLWSDFWIGDDEASPSRLVFGPI